MAAIDEKGKLRVWLFLLKGCPRMRNTKKRHVSKFNYGDCPFLYGNGGGRRYKVLYWHEVGVGF